MGEVEVKSRDCLCTAYVLKGRFSLSADLGPTSETPCLKAKVVQAQEETMVFLFFFSWSDRRRILTVMNAHYDVVNDCSTKRESCVHKRRCKRVSVKRSNLTAFL